MIISPHVDLRRNNELCAFLLNYANKEKKKKKLTCKCSFIKVLDSMEEPNFCIMPLRKSDHFLAFWMTDFISYDIAYYIVSKYFYCLQHYSQNNK